jgi:hypothetical protein
MLPSFAAIFELDDGWQQKNPNRQKHFFQCVSAFVYKGKMHFDTQKTGKLQKKRKPKAAAGRPLENAESKP